MMDFFWRNVVAEFQPDGVQKVDFFWREVRSMWAKVEHVLLSTREVDDQRQLRLGIDLIPSFGTKLSMISAKERGSRYVEEQAHRGADHRGVEATGSGA